MNVDELPDCGDRFSASVVCTLPLGHSGAHHDIENVTIQWLGNGEVAEAANRQAERWRGALDLLADQ